MKKIGIITLNGYSNYGNRLQNYAIEYTLIKLGFDINTLVIRDNNKTEYSNKKIAKKILNMSLGTIIIKFYFIIINKINKKRYFHLNNNRENRFKIFSKLYLHEKEIKFGNISEDLNNEYSYFITGSDQVWNPLYVSNRASIYFLAFAEKGKKIAYAPSFGISKIPDEYISQYKEWLSQMDNLSVREKAGADIINELISKDAPVHVDPTLLLSREEWLSISKPHINKPTEKFLVTYFLGKKSKEVERYIKLISRENKFKIVNLASLKDKKYYDADPSEFLDFLNSAEIIFTDSFHGSVFSILFKKPFVIFERLGKLSMISRIDTLLELFNLESRKWDNIVNRNDLFYIDYSKSNAVLEREYLKSIEYLKNSLKMDL